MERKESREKNVDMVFSLISDNMSKEKKISVLYKIIEEEINKDVPDEKLVSECTDYINRLNAEKKAVSEVQVESVLHEIEGKFGSDNTSLKKAGGKSAFTNNWGHSIGKMAASFVLVFVFSFSSVTVYGYDIFLHTVEKNWDVIYGGSVGDKVYGDGITIIKNGTEINYESLENMLKEEHLNIVSPSYFPENIKLENIMLLPKEGDNYMLIYQFNNDNLNFVISNYYQNDFSEWENYTLYKYKDMVYYIVYNDSIYYGASQFEGYEYYIKFNDYNEIINIINSLDGVKI